MKQQGSVHFKGDGAGIYQISGAVVAKKRKKKKEKKHFYVKGLKEMCHFG